MDDPQVEVLSDVWFCVRQSDKEAYTKREVEVLLSNAAYLILPGSHAEKVAALADSFPAPERETATAAS